MSSWTCELSGEPLSGSGAEEIVVTPSGHVCLKRLLLTKLADNGGMDPFVDDSVQLEEDQLIPLSTKKIIPPRPHVTSMPALLGLLQTEYDALVLELFDTRKALEDTRKELSHALYQNDAATRVVARLAMERDAARQELQQWKASSGTVVVEESTTAAVAVEQEEPPTKRAKVDKETNIPESDVVLMTETWQELSKQRKQRKKEIASQTWSVEQVAKFAELDHKSWHKTRNKAGIVDMHTCGDKLITAGRDKQLVVYSMSDKTLVHTIPTSVVVTCVDMNEQMIVAGRPDGKVVVFSMQDGAAVGDALELNSESKVVNVALHPTGRHVVATTENGTIYYCRFEEDNSSSLTVVTKFSPPNNETYTSGALHPDGLIYAAGTSEGVVHLWDFKSQQLASTLESDETKGAAIVAIAFSNNGYHVALATDANVVQVRDLKKSKVLSTLEGSHCVAFDESGKYLAFGGEKEGATVVTAKEATVVATISSAHEVTGLVWTVDKQIVTCGDGDRQVRFYGLSEDDMEE